MALHPAIEAYPLQESGEDGLEDSGEDVADDQDDDRADQLRYVGEELPHRIL